MIPKWVYRSSVYDEFTKEERQNYFSLTSSKVVPHIDNLYYTVSIKDDKGGEETPENVKAMIERLHEMKTEVKRDYNACVKFLDLNVERFGFSIYEFQLSCPEYYDIFVSSYIPNEQTPRVHVQIRSAFLVLEGELKALEESYRKVKEILNFFGLVPLYCRENRIDFAYHTNLLQKPGDVLSKTSFAKHLRSNFKIGDDVFNIGAKIETSYISLGMRRSNNVFFRAYNKSREVCELGYKSFFLDRWLEHGLISKYDYEVYMVAYVSKSFTVGTLIGRIKWYLDHGKNSELKAELRDLLSKCYERSSNSEQIRKKIKGVLPAVTTICNIEFETKRKFYASFESWLHSFELLDYTGEQVLAPLIRILMLRQTIHEYLTTVLMKIVKDNSKKNSELCDWWRRITGCNLTELPGFGDFKRNYDRKPDILRAKRSFGSSAAYLAMLIRESTAEQTFEEDLSDIFSDLNDNHFHGFAPDPVTGELAQLNCPPGYASVQRRKIHQNKAIIERYIREKSQEREEAERLRLAWKQYGEGQGEKQKENPPKGGLRLSARGDIEVFE